MKFLISLIRTLICIPLAIALFLFLRARRVWINNNVDAKLDQFFS